MYKITFPTGEVAIIEKPNFIHVHKNNCYILCERSKADGVAYHGTPHLFADGTMVREVDAGEELLALQAENLTLRQQLIDAEEALIELYEAMEVTSNG